MAQSIAAIAAQTKKTSSTLGILSFCAFEQEIGSVGELTGLGVACREHEADAGVFGIDFSSGAEVVTGSGIILPNEADIAEEAQNFELLIGSQRDLFSSFFEEFDGVDVLMLLGEGDGHVRSGGEEVRVELYGVFEIDAGIGELSLCIEIQATLEEAANANDI